MAESERRRYVRFALPVRVAVKGRGLSESCAAEQLGMGGCMITLTRQLPEGAQLQVELSAEGPLEPVAGIGQIAWVSPAAPWRTGLSFSAPLVEAMGPFLRGLVGPAKLTP